MKKMMTFSLGCVLFGVLSVPAFAIHKGSELPQSLCPSAALIKANTVFNVAIEDGGKYLVFAASPVVTGDEIYWVTVGRNLVADSLGEALNQAKDLLSSLSGPLSDMPTPYTFPDDGLTVNACQYQTKNPQVVITAVPDDES